MSDETIHESHDLYEIKSTKALICRACKACPCHQPSAISAPCVGYGMNSHR